MTIFDSLRADRHARRHRHRRRCGRSTRRSATSDCGQRVPTQYLELAGDFAEFYEVDPHTPVTERDPINEDTDVAILGGGFAGLLAGAYLKKAGVDGIRVIEMAGDFGGVWYWNRFPDPVRQRRLLLHPAARRARLHAVEEVRRRRRDLRALPQHRQALRPLRRCAVLHPGARTALGRSDASAGGSAPTAATTSGPGSSSWRRVPQPPEAARHPRHQGLPGGTCSTPRAGTTTTPAATPTAALDKLADKRVALVGTGATGIQLVPHLGEMPSTVRLSAHAVVRRRARQPPTDPDWVTSLQPGWQEERKRNFHPGRRSTAWSSASRTWSATSGPSSAAT